MFSGGKDSVAALLELADDPGAVVEHLIATVNQDNDRVALHGTPRALLQAQADAFGLPLTVIGLPPDCDNDSYIERVAAGLAPLQDAGVTALAFGDLFLEDIRRFRERQFAGSGFELRFPLWGRPTRALAEALIDRGLRALVCCVDLEKLPEAFLGRVWDRAFLDDLPDGVDPCGENGEFHTVVVDAPGMRGPLAVSAGGRHVSHQRFCMLDLQPA